MKSKLGSERFGSGTKGLLYVKAIQKKRKRTKAQKETGSTVGLQNMEKEDIVDEV